MPVPAVAVIADAHFHDTTADVGTGLRVGTRHRALRSWHDTASGARAINESAAALDAALAAVRARGLRHVILLGDYTDDGQVGTTDRLAALLQDQTRRHGLHFYVVPGNHDVWGPFGKHTATRFAARPDRSVLVTSDPVMAADEPDAILSPALRCAGQPEGLTPMAAFGLFRQPRYRHWETPFGTADDPATRMYDAVSADGSVTQRLMDASYLVEPEAGLWLLMIDANVFEPRNGIADPRRKRAFLDPSTAGWNAVLRVKPFLLPWIADVTRRASARGKHLLVLSHYPVLDPFEDDGSETALFGDSDVALRTPGPQVAARLAAAGVRLHFSGHIHANGTTRHGTGPGGLANVAVPSLTAWPPGFVIVSPDSGRVETVSLAAVPLDPALMDFYRASPGGGEVPDVGHLGDFLLAQTRARTRAHHIPRGFPARITPFLAKASVADLVGLLFRKGDGAVESVADWCGARHLDPGDLVGFRLTDLIADWYAVRQGGALAAGVLSPPRLRIARSLVAAFADAAADPATDVGFFARWLSMLDRAIPRMERDQTA